MPGGAYGARFALEPRGRWFVRAHHAAAAASQVEHHEIDGSLPEVSRADRNSVDHALDDTPEAAKQRFIVWARSSVDRTTAASLLQAELRMQPHPPGGLEALIARQEYVSRIAALANALPALTKEQRRIVVLRYVEDRSLREIPQTDGVDPKKVQDILCVFASCCALFSASSFVRLDLKWCSSATRAPVFAAQWRTSPRHPSPGCGRCRLFSSARRHTCRRSVSRIDQCTGPL